MNTNELMDEFGIPNDTNLPLFLACLEDAFLPRRNANGEFVRDRNTSLDAYFEQKPNDPINKGKPRKT
jgi:hypothetical protein